MANASHELRTPLTTLTGEIEVALMKEREKEEYIQVLHSALEETKTLTKLSNDLLKLTQTGDLKGLLVKNIALSELIQAIAEDTAKRNAHGILQFEISPSLDTSTLFVRGNLDLLKISILNVIENGFKFSYDQPVRLIVDADNRSVFLEIKDQGIGMQEEELDFVFQPFYRGEQVSAFQGTGIGLSLTQRIISIHGGSISIESSPAVGTSVKISLILEPLRKNLF